MLTTFSTIFTIEVWLMAFPAYKIFQRIDPFPYALALVPWFALMLFAMGVYFRPQLAAAYRRVAAVFE